MTISLYSATVPSYLQMLASVSRLVDKAEAHCLEKGIAPDEIIAARLAEDMLPFAYQVKSTVVHSVGAIEGVRRGEFSPDRTTPPDSLAALNQQVQGAIDTLAAIDPAEIESFIGRDMAFVFGERRVPYAAEDFLLSFSQPNFYFHATTAYAILRANGLAIGKTDYLGRVRKKVAA